MVKTGIPFCVSEEAAGSSGLKGHVCLVCAPDLRGRTVVRKQSFSAPVHFSKPYEDSGSLVINLVNPTAGYFAGDRVTCRVDVESGASVVLTSPSASRVHRTMQGNARLEQYFRVRAGAWLEVFPELFIPQAGANYHQRTDVELDEGGELLLFETLAPGRVASGEAFGYARLQWETRLLHAGRLVVQERYVLSPGDESLDALRARFPAAYLASCFAISPRLKDDNSCWRTISEWADDKVLAGCSRLVAGGYVVKLLAADSVTFRRQIAEMRRLLYEALERETPTLRRI